MDQPTQQSAMNRTIPAYGVVDVQYFVQQVVGARRMIVRLCIAFALIATIYAVRPAPYEIHSTVNIQPADMRSLFSGGVRNINSEIDSIRSWTTVERVLQQMKYHGVVTPEGALARKKPLEQLWLFITTGKKHDDEKKALIEVGQLELPEALQGKRLRLRVLSRDRYVVENRQGDELFTGFIGKPASGMLTIRQGDETPKQAPYVLDVQAVNAPIDSTFTLIPLNEEKMIEQALTNLKVYKRTNNPGSSLIDVRFFHGDPHFAMIFTQALLDDYVYQSFERLSASKQQAIERAQADLEQAEGALETSEMALADYLKQVDVADIELENRHLHELRLTVYSSLKEVVAQRLRYQEVYTDIHPAMKAIKAQEADLTDKLQHIEQRLAALPEMKSTLYALNRKVEQMAGHYQSVMKRYTELRIDVGSVVNNVTVVNLPRIVRRNLRNKAIQIIVLGGMMGLIIGLSVILLQASIRRGVLHRAGQLEHFSALSVVDLDEVGGGKDEVASGYRIALQTVVEQLPYLAHGRKNNVMMVTGHRLSRCKSRIAYRLAEQLAQAKQNVLLIDAQMRESYLAGLVDVASGADSGLSNAMVGKATPKDITVRIGKSRLYYMPSGHPVMNYQILRHTERFTHLLDELSQLFDAVVVDVPPASELVSWQQVVAQAGTVFHVVAKEQSVGDVSAYLSGVSRYALEHDDHVDVVMLHQPLVQKQRATVNPLDILARQIRRWLRG